MNPIVIAAIVGSILILSSSGKRGNKRRRPRIKISDDCSQWEIDDKWFENVASPKYESMFDLGVVPASFQEAIPFLVDNLLVEEVGACSSKREDSPEAMKGMYDHISSIVEEGLSVGINPFMVAKKDILHVPSIGDITAYAVKKDGGFFGAANTRLAWPPTEENVPVVTSILDSPEAAIRDLHIILLQDVVESAEQGGTERSDGVRASQILNVILNPELPKPKKV